jgi:hypothetical protein
MRTILFATLAVTSLLVGQADAAVYHLTDPVSSLFLTVNSSNVVTAVSGENRGDIGPFTLLNFGDNLLSLVFPYFDVPGVNFESTSSTNGFTLERSTTGANSTYLDLEVGSGFESAIEVTAQDSSLTLVTTAVPESTSIPVTLFVSVVGLFVLTRRLRSA